MDHINTPHNLWWAVNKIIGIVMWVTIVKSDDSEKEGRGL